MGSLTSVNHQSPGSLIFSLLHNEGYGPRDPRSRWLCHVQQRLPPPPPPRYLLLLSLPQQWLRLLLLQVRPPWPSPQRRVWSSPTLPVSPLSPSPPRHYFSARL